MSSSDHGAIPRVLTLSQLAEQLALDALELDKKRRPGRVKAMVSGVKGYARGTSTSKDVNSERSVQADRCAKHLLRRLYCKRWLACAAAGMPRSPHVRLDERSRSFPSLHG